MVCREVDNATFKYAVSGSKDSQPLTKNNKLNACTYTLYAYVSGETKPVAETEFTVVQRALRCALSLRRTALIGPPGQSEHPAFSLGRHEKHDC